MKDKTFILVFLQLYIESGILPVFYSRFEKQFVSSFYRIKYFNVSMYYLALGTAIINTALAYGKKPTFCWNERKRNPSQFQCSFIPLCHFVEWMEMSNFFQIETNFCFLLLFTDYILVLAIVVAIFDFAHGAPQMRRLRRHKYDPEYPHYPARLMWNQSCGNELTFGTAMRVVSLLIFLAIN